MKTAILYFSLILLLTSCDGCETEYVIPKTELEKLPPATQEGKHTFGCLVNGESWVTETSTRSWAFYQEGVLAINARLTDKDIDQGIYIHLYDKYLIEKEYFVSNYVDPFSNIAGLGDDIAKRAFQTTTEYSGTVVITHLDQRFGKWIISGTFEFEAYSSDCQDTVKVTDGRFDLNYAP